MNLRFNISVKIIIVLVIISMVCCTRTTSEVPEDCFKLWSGKDPDSETKIVHAKYWQSGKLLKEYALYMELQPSPAWQKEFMRENKLVEIDDDDEWTVPKDAPVWFTPSASYKIMKLPLPYGESRYFVDSLSDHMFIFEIEI